MSNLQLQWLADELRAAGLDVVEHTGWKTRTMGTVNTYRPRGILNHHTAGRYYLSDYPEGHWPDSSLDSKCNITIRPDGEVHVLNAGYAYDSGMGDPDVLNRLLRDDEPTAPTDFTEGDRINGNPFFIDVEVQHLGDGSPIEKVQYRSLIKVNAVVCIHYDWNPLTRVLMHRGWTTRKVDPRWNGFSNPGYTIRQHTNEEMEALMPLTSDDVSAIWSASWGSGDNRETAGERLAMAAANSAAALAIVRRQATGVSLSDADIDRIIAEHAESFGLIERD